MNHKNKNLLTAKDDLNNIPDGWYYFLNADNPINTVVNTYNSMLFQTSFPSGRNVKIQILFSESVGRMFFRLMKNDGIWHKWAEITKVAI